MLIWIMLMQIAAWVIGISVAMLGLAYAAIFVAMLAARFRQAHAEFRAGSAAPAAVRAPRMLPRQGMDTISH